MRIPSGALRSWPLLRSTPDLRSAKPMGRSCCRRSLPERLQPVASFISCLLLLALVPGTIDSSEWRTQFRGNHIRVNCGRVSAAGFDLPLSGSRIEGGQLRLGSQCAAVAVGDRYGLLRLLKFAFAVDCIQGKDVPCRQIASGHRCVYRLGGVDLKCGSSVCNGDLAVVAVDVPGQNMRFGSQYKTAPVAESKVFSGECRYLPPEAVPKRVAAFSAPYIRQTAKGAPAYVRRQRKSQPG